MKKTIYTFLLLFCFTLTAHSQNSTESKNTKLVISYDVSTFCANTKGISTPTVSETGGVYKSIRISSGVGALAINQATGLIDRNISNAGTYEIVYTIGKESTSTTLTVTNCKF